MPHQGSEQKVAALLEQECSVKQWLEQIRALDKDANGHIVVRGLSMDETEELLRLRPLVQSPDAGLTRVDLAAARERYAELRAKLDTALQDEAIEGLSSWGSN
jgi:DNA-binding GntR family transcriptional regulator